MRVFIGIDIPEDIKARISEVSARLHINGLVPVRESAYHITLQFLGEVPEEGIANIEDALSRVRPGKFEAEIRGLSFFSPRYLKVIFARLRSGDPELRALYRKIDSQLLKNGIAYEKERDYAPHVTIARVKYVKGRREVISRIEEYSDYEFGNFVVDSFALKKSIQKDDGPVYSDLCKFKL